MLTRETGFTMIEMMFVLSITIMLTVVILPIRYKWVRTNTEENAIASLVTTIYSLQSYAMAHNQYTRLSFRSEGEQTMYVAAVPGIGELSRKLFPEGMYVSSSSSMKSVEFHANGDIVQSGVLVIVGKTSRTTITFQFQRGRMIISESERLFLARGSPYNNNHFGHFWYIIATRHKYDDDATQKEIGNARC